MYAFSVIIITDCYISMSESVRALLLAHSFFVSPYLVGSIACAMCKKCAFVLLDLHFDE